MGKKSPRKHAWDAGADAWTALEREIDDPAVRGAVLHLAIAIGRLTIAIELMEDRRDGGAEGLREQVEEAFRKA